MRQVTLKALLCAFKILGRQLFCSRLEMLARMLYNEQLFLKLYKTLRGLITLSDYFFSFGNAFLKCIAASCENCPSALKCADFFINFSPFSFKLGTPCFAFCAIIKSSQSRKRRNITAVRYYICGNMLVFGQGLSQLQNRIIRNGLIDRKSFFNLG